MRRQKRRFRWPRFLPEAMLAYVEKTRVQWLGPLVPDLPSYERVISDLHPLTEWLLANSE